jgi:hypothetical protein
MSDVTAEVGDHRKDGAYLDDRGECGDAGIIDLQPRSPSAIVRWPVLDTGRNSVTLRGCQAAGLRSDSWPSSGPREGAATFAAGSAPNVTSGDARRGARRRQLTEPHLDEPESRGRGNPDGKLSLTEDQSRHASVRQGPIPMHQRQGHPPAPGISLPHARASEHRALTGAVQ